MPNYNAAPQAQQSFTVGKGAQTITFTSTAPSGAVVGGPIYTVTATGGASANSVVCVLHRRVGDVGVFDLGGHGQLHRRRHLHDRRQPGR